MTAQKLCDVPFLHPSNSPGELVVDPGLGRKVLYQSMYSGVPGHPPALVRCDFERHEYASFRQPDGRGSWRVRLLSDGKLWFGMNGPGQLACFDPLTERFASVPTYTPSAPTSHLTDVIEGADGRLYMPSFPAGALVAFDRSTAEYQEYPVARKNHQLYAACLADNGCIGVLNGLQHGVYAVDTQSGEVQQRSPGHLFGRAGAYSQFVRYGDEFLLTVGNPRGGLEICRFSAVDLGFVTSFVVSPERTEGPCLFLSPSGDVYLGVDDGLIYAVDLEHGRAEQAWHIPRVPSRGTYHFLDAGHILFAGSAQQYGTYDLVSGEFASHRTDIDNPPVDIFSILPTSSGATYCSAGLGLTLTRVDPQRRDGDILGLVYNGSGEIYGSAEAESRIYSVSYTHATLTVYDPEKPWSPGPEPEDNPRNLGSLGPEQYRPVTGILNGPGGKLYAGTMPGYGARGGALTVVDPSDDTKVCYRHLVPDHSILGLATGPDLAYLGTSVIADGFIEQTDGDASFLLFDPAAGQVLERVSIQGARSVITVGFSSGTVYFWTDDHAGGQRLFRCAGAIDSLREIPHGLGHTRVINRPMVSRPDGLLFFSAAGGIAVLDTATEAVDWAWRGSGNVAYLGSAPDGILFSQGHELWLLSA